MGNIKTGIDPVFIFAVFYECGRRASGFSHVFSLSVA